MEDSETMYYLHWSGGSSRGNESGTNTSYYMTPRTNHFQVYFHKQAIILPQVKTSIKFAGSHGENYLLDRKRIDITDGFMNIKYNMHSDKDRLRVKSDDNTLNIDTGMKSYRDGSPVISKNLVNFNQNVTFSVNEIQEERGRESVFKIKVEIFDYANGKKIYTYNRGAIRKARKHGFKYF